jgi:tetratricopeptide (TPR) repeat protein
MQTHGQSLRGEAKAEAEQCAGHGDKPRRIPMRALLLPWAEATLRAMPIFKIASCAAFASLALLSMGSIAQTSQSRALEDIAYQDCLSLVRRNPEEGFAQAQVWQSTGGGLAAAHCGALALVELKHYADAADRLEQLLPLAEKQAPHLTVAILDQAANAWLLAEQPQRARQLLDIAVNAAPHQSDILIDRAIALAALDDHAAARADLDRALSLEPTRADAYALRASARRQLNDPAGALEDAETALALEPRLPEALLERGILRLNIGDRKGARADLIQVRLIAPDSPAAVAAGRYIEEMDVKAD